VHFYKPVVKFLIFTNYFLPYLKTRRLKGKNDVLRFLFPDVLLNRKHRAW